MQDLHVAIIMDGNGRWATERGRRRSEGHTAGADAVRRAVEAAPDCGVTDLTLYAFSSDNWNRPLGEVAGLMRQFQRYLLNQREQCVANRIRVSIIGRRDRLPRRLLPLIAAIEESTRSGERLHLRIAIDYSARDLIVSAAANHSRPLTRDSFAAAIAKAAHTDAIPAVDLLIRTGREKRLSDFLLWESAYAELCFLDVLWPDFDKSDLRGAVDEFHRRVRRFGTITSSTQAEYASSQR